jgi:hypothetical protein
MVSTAPCSSVGEQVGNGDLLQHNAHAVVGGLATLVAGGTSRQERVGEPNEGPGRRSQQGCCTRLYYNSITNSLSLACLLEFR